MKIKVVGDARPGKVSAGTSTSQLNSTPRTIQAQSASMQPSIPLERANLVANRTPTAPKKGKKYVLRSSQAKQRQRTRRRIQYSFLRRRSFTKTSPNKYLAAHEKFVKGLRAKWVNNDRRCSMDEIRYLENLEDLSVSRFGMLRGFRTNGEPAIERRKNKILEQMEDKICELQRFYNEKLEKLSRVRRSLRISYQQRFICCKWCVASDKNVRD